MENFQLILNSNSLCVICLSEVEAKVCKKDLFRLHHLTSKINTNLRNVFQDITVPGVTFPVLDRMEILAEACEGCTDICEEFLYNFTDNAETTDCVELILDLMEEVGVADVYENCGSPLAAFYSGIVDRLRKEIIQKLHVKLELEAKSNQSTATKTSTGFQGVPSLLNIPDLPMSQICSYLYREDIRNCSTVSKKLRQLVFPSLINSCPISFENRRQIPAVRNFIKAISSNIKKDVSLDLTSESLEYLDSRDRSALLKLFQECGSHIRDLKLICRYGRRKEIVNGLQNNNSIPVLGKGNALLPCLKRLEIEFSEIWDEVDDSEYDSSDDEYDHFDLEGHYRKRQIDAYLSFIRAVFGNSPNLMDLMLNVYSENECSPEFVADSLFKFIGESELRIDTLEINMAMHMAIKDEHLGYLYSLNLKKLVIKSKIELKESHSLTNFLESQRHTLKHLKLENTFYNFRHFIFPQMECLETYKLGPCDMVNTENKGPISFHTQLPKLKKIELFCIDFKPENEDYFQTLFPFDAKPATSVKELALTTRNVEKCNLMRTICFFNCLSKLEIPVASYLQDCWKDLTGLEELTLHSFKPGKKFIWIDEAISGVAFYQMDFRKKEWAEKEYEKTQATKSLVLLKRLRLLRLRHEKYSANDRRLQLSDITCQLVLMKMESLKCIDFCGIRPFLAGPSKKILDEMGKKMDLLFGEDLKCKGCLGCLQFNV